MARVRYDPPLSLLTVLALVWTWLALAAEAVTGLYGRPMPILDPEMHTATIRRADVSATGRYAVTGSYDKTVRVWSLTDGRLERTIRLPSGPGAIGQVNAVAISPDGNFIAAGGYTTPALPHYFYLFDRATGDMLRRIDGLPNVVFHLTFSPDGRYLAATLGGANGLRVYDRMQRWAEVARDITYGDSSLGAAFAQDGRLATTSLDGTVRLYDRTFHLVATVKTTEGQQPIGIAFSPRGSMLAIGHADIPIVALLDGSTLAPLPAPDTSGIDNGSLGTIAWSADGSTLFAAGRYHRSGTSAIVAWAAAGAGARRELLVGTDIIMTLAPLADGALLVAAGDPYLTVLDPTGRERWRKLPPQADFRYQDGVLAVSFDGLTVDFHYGPWRQAPARFALAQRELTVDPAHDGRTAAPTQDSLPVSGWLNTTPAASPTLAGQSLRLRPNEISRSLAIHPDGQRFILGTNWYLRAFDATGEALWQQVAPSIVWAVNITGDGRLVVAAYSDGTIRWHRMDDGNELLAFFPLADRKNWVAWTPEGVYAATPDARGVLRWHVNRGFDESGEAIPVWDIPEQLHPEVLPLVLQHMDGVTALGLYTRAKIRRAVTLRTNSAIPPGTQLHVLAIGVSEYNTAFAKHLRLEFAAADAHDVASTLLNTQQSLYAKVEVQTLRNSEATKAGIVRALDTLYMRMQPDDVAVVHFSGHGALVDGRLYLLPYEVDARDSSAIKASAFEIDDFRAQLHRLAERGLVLALLDACRSGAATADGIALTVDARLLRATLVTDKLTVLTASTSTENALEHAAWKNGAFTEVFLEALSLAADTDRNGVISMTELTHYLTAGVPQLVRQVRPEWLQTPGIEVRFQHSIFAVGP